MECKDIQKLLTDQKQEVVRLKGNDIPHVEAELKTLRDELATYERNVKYLTSFLETYKALISVGLIEE